MYMSLFDDKNKICEVNIYCVETSVKNKWCIRLDTWFNIKNTLILFKDLTDSEDFIETMANIQGYMLGYNENTDKDLPEFKTYDFDTEYNQMNQDKNELIRIIRERLYNIAREYDLAYKED